MCESISVKLLNISPGIGITSNTDLVHFVEQNAGYKIRRVRFSPIQKKKLLFRRSVQMTVGEPTQAKVVVPLI